MSAAATAPMKVLIADGTYSFGGAFEMALILAENLKRSARAEPVLVSSQPPKVLKERVRDIAYRFLKHRERWRSASQSRLARVPAALLNLMLRDLPTALQLAWLAKREGAQLIHLNNQLNSQPYGVLAALLAGIPCVYSHRDFEYDSPFVRWIEKRVTLHIACSQAIADNLRSIGVPLRKIAFVWDGVDSSRFNPSVPPADLESLFGIPRDRLVFSIFGRLVRWKGHETFLRAAAQVLAVVPQAHAMLVGGVSDGEPTFENRLRALADELKIGSRVTFTGYRSDTPELTRASDVCVHASISPEPFGTVVLEAMACARPCIAMNEGGPLEMIEDEVSGILSSPGDADAMAQAIIRLLRDERLRTDMGRAARERIDRLFSAQAYADRFYRAYRSVLQ